MIDFVIIVILVVVVGSALAYIIKERKKGVKCIGCPEGCHSCRSAQGTSSACECNNKASTNCGCHTNTN